ncbi:hypothetical protein EVAR_97807_1 [Eumeta japonica]|uniref:Integrase catalytic domain-containing protein n=1 Tax=Eumeta variegata TaxID=151549 RepID=A0A4C1XC82_EUMVA|nr:hypothetical protein EVAR_97807_1 [Eumeta japonica]
MLGMSKSEDKSTPLTKFHLPRARLTQIHIDLIGPLPPSHGYCYCLTVIDRFTRWPEIIPIVNITVETVVKALLSDWIARFGCPVDIATDRAAQFESSLFQYLTIIIGFEHRRSTAYHSVCDDLIEPCYRQLKAAIMRHADAN